MVRHIIATNKLAAEYQANNVLYQCASTDMTHNQNIAALENPAKGKNKAAHTLILWWCEKLEEP